MSNIMFARVYFDGGNGLQNSGAVNRVPSDYKETSPGVWEHPEGSLGDGGAVYIKVDIKSVKDLSEVENEDLLTE